MTLAGRIGKSGYGIPWGTISTFAWRNENLGQDVRQLGYNPRVSLVPIVSPQGYRLASLKGSRHPNFIHHSDFQYPDIINCPDLPAHNNMTTAIPTALIRTRDDVSNNIRTFGYQSHVLFTVICTIPAFNEKR